VLFAQAPHVFVVDDEPVIASTLAAILQMHGFSAKFFTSPLEALTAARAKSPDLLISDVEMPGFSGIDLAIQMRAQYPTCKILLFSGRPATSDLVDAARAQGHDFDLLLKPILPTELLSEIRKRLAARAISPRRLKLPPNRNSAADSLVSAVGRLPARQARSFRSVTKSRRAPGNSSL
jgi:DNA-binding response OmpR family regulator